MRRFLHHVALGACLALTNGAWAMTPSKNESLKGLDLANITMEQAMGVFQAGDASAAAQLFSLLAQQGNTSAKNMLGYLHEIGAGVDVNYDVALQWYIQAAQEKSVVAYERIGYFHEHGLAVSTNHEVAAQWYERAAEQGNALAMLRLARLYRDGRGVLPNEDRALALFLASAQKGQEQARYEAALMLLLSPNITETTLAEGVRQLELASANAHPQAQRELGLALLEGRLGLNVDATRAAELFTLAADAGDASAQRYLALMYVQGQGVAQNHARAYELMKLSASQGDAQSQYELGVLYEQGLGAAYSLPRAYMWLAIAAEQSDDPELVQSALSKRDVIMNAMTEPERDQALKITLTCKAKNFLVC